MHRPTGAKVPLIYHHKMGSRELPVPGASCEEANTNAYSQTDDYRYTSAKVEPIADVMPSIDVALEHCRASVPQKQQRVHIIYDQIKECSLLHACLKEMLDEYGFIMNPKKCSLFQTKVSMVWTHHNFEKYASTKTGAELQQLLCASYWMRSGLVGYVQQCDHSRSGLTRRVENGEGCCGKQMTFSTAEPTILEGLKDLLRHSTLLAYSDRAKQLCVLSDTSTSDWVQITGGYGDSFIDFAFNWSVIENENYPILLEYRYLIKHISGIHNVWDDMGRYRF
ncbi:Hypothetical protein PHPALM_37167 [Phytophthora palmivora]|uniref:Uncharacterized protein n=1 Tax=Phytophthora palmivora TaxID=4796 RepID=A0A2P4WY38_9STRA|nr:Hypothetical protein PHPALM_37167 [Phytophthora palmivora]